MFPLIILQTNPAKANYILTFIESCLNKNNCQIFRRLFVIICFYICCDFVKFILQDFQGQIYILTIKLLFIQQPMKVLLLGAYGQVGQDLFRVLSNKIGAGNIYCNDIKNPPVSLGVQNHLRFDVLNKQHLFQTVKKYQINQIYCLTALLSVTGQKNPLYTNDLNMNSLLYTLQAARQFKVDKVFWPSSIAAFGHNTDKNARQHVVMEPSTVYGITKKAGQLWCQYYHARYGVDVRSLRYPGLIGWRCLPGGGTTDYAVDIFHKALKGQTYYCYLKPDTYLPMIYSDDAINATIQLMQADSKKVTIRTSYNLGAISFSPREIAQQIKKHIPSFKIEYRIIEQKQKIAQSWPTHIDYSVASTDWDWKPEYNLQGMVKDMLKNLKV